ncbi:hypothetical protein A1Q2_03124 [Trichosporon asahii var. asahii CBS 8904]|uniref:Uncharacterized protein n=1 Tax=Trichosporon asahii var. asahii (strain CBS 8904) TaxID=1220162 RepID=K1W0G4_TRIAC|nr:hypothetical protein A1Q2_03124 [Trichosporon asahii var. asahii CBS 8904]
MFEITSVPANALLLYMPMRSVGRHPKTSNIADCRAIPAALRQKEEWAGIGHKSSAAMAGTKASLFHSLRQFFRFRRARSASLLPLALVTAHQPTQL